MRFVLVSDVHLDAPFSWAPPAVARSRRQMLRDSLLAALALVDEERADAVPLGSDLFEHERITPDTTCFLRDALGDVGRPVLLAPGNHDWLAPDSAYHQVADPPNVHLFTEDRLHPHELAAGLTVWGAAHRAPANTDGFLDGFTVGDRSGVHLALFHGSARDGLRFERSGKVPHAPFDAEQVERAGLHHALLGHHHTPRAAGRYTYPGNPAPLTFGEHGDRGAVVVDVGPDGAVVRRWRVIATSAAHDVVLDVTGCRSLQDVRAAAVERLRGLGGVARLTIVGDLAGEVDLHPSTDLASRALGLGDAGPAHVVVRTGALRHAHDLEALAAEPTVRGEFVRQVLAAELAQQERDRVLAAGLRALDGRDDLEVVG